MIIHESTFEANLNGWEKEIIRPDAIVLTKERARKGTSCAKFNFRKTDVPYLRAELRQPAPKEANQWYGFSNYLPADWVDDPIPEVIAQWHEIPDFDLGEGWRSPPLSLMVERGRYWLKILWGSARVNSNSTLEGQKLVDLGPIDKEKWNDWVFHIDFNYTAYGLVEVWKNGVKIYTLHGPNSFNDQYKPYFKIGIYKWGWATHASFSPAAERTLYYDEVRIGDSRSNFTEVSPI